MRQAYLFVFVTGTIQHHLKIRLMMLRAQVGKWLCSAVQLDLELMMFYRESNEQFSLKTFFFKYSFAETILAPVSVFTFPPPKKMPFNFLLTSLLNKRLPSHISYANISGY